MTKKSGLLSATCLALVLFTPIMSDAQEGGRVKLADAKPGDVRLFVSGALRAPVEAVRDSLEKATGHHIVIEAGESRMLQTEIIAGQPFEAALITRPVIDDMIAKGRVVQGSRVDIGVVRVGVAIRGDAPKLDITSPDGLKKAILGAHGVRRFYGVGASVPTLDNLFTKLNLVDATKSTVIPLGVGKPAPEAPLQAGQYELIINLASEVIPLKGWTYLGLIPEQYQMPVYLAAGIGTQGDAAAAKKVIAVLQDPAFDQVLKSDAMSRR
jgi:molybdate transport system substrate-binding protein